MRVKPIKPSSRHAAGFTLIEVMITVAIVAILAAVAMPSYQNYIRRGQLSDAFTTLSDMRVKMEQYYQDNKFYGAAANSTTCPQLPGYNTAFPVTTKYFTFACGPGTAAATPLQTFVITATGSGGLTTGYNYTLNERGTKGTAAFAGNTMSGVACWLTKSTACDN
jgi:type IV pilus assembly protein PilE